MALHDDIVLAPSNGLDGGGVLWGEAAEGTTQGNPETDAYFCIGIHHPVRESDRKLSEKGGLARFGWDDGYLIGHPEEVISALDAFSTQVSESCGPVLQRTKTEL